MAGSFKREWDIFRGATIPQDVSDTELKKWKVLFYSGGLAMLHAVVDSLPHSQDLYKLASLQEDVNDFTLPIMEEGENTDILSGGLFITSETSQ